jgi:cysteine desulfurase
MVDPVIYLDYNSTTPVDSRVVEHMMPFFTRYFGNASSKTHSYGWEAEAAVETARGKVAELIGSTPEEIIFTSGSTESINVALQGLAIQYGSKKKHIISCVTEHKAVIDTCLALEQKGVEITWLNVDRNGNINTEDLIASIKDTTLCVSLMMANNETGVIHPVDAIGKVCHERGVFFFTDATQAAGKLRIDVAEMNIDLLSLSAHKIYGPKGCGALYIRRKNPSVKPAPFLFGGGHEKGLRPGTLNVPGIAGFGKASEIAMQELWEAGALQSNLRTRLEQLLEKELPIRINGDMRSRLFNTSNICFSGIKAASLIKALPELAFSTGSACTSALPEPSHVLKAMGLDNDSVFSSVRFSIGRFTTQDEINHASKHIINAVKTLSA